MNEPETTVFRFSMLAAGTEKEQVSVPVTSEKKPRTSFFSLIP